MNTAQLKSFASEARISLLSGVKSKMNALGFKENGEVDERDFPIKAPDGTLFQNEIYDVAFYEKWMRLHEEIKRCGFRQVCEEGAYTWFNRLMAIRILAKNKIINPVLEFESPDIRIPVIVKHAHDGIRPDMPAFDTMRLDAIIDDDNRITDQFAILIVAYCQTTPILYKCFGMLNDFTELLLPTNILASNGFLNLLNSSSFITDEDFKTTELIGWLYQFYISDRKDEVFASFKKGKKAEANDIPAATQIFTPNWIVKYMVQNTIGRIWLDNNPYCTLKDDWKYLVEQNHEVSEDSILKVTDIEKLTFADLSCGSGHILGEAFDILFSIYKDEGFNRRQAITSIFNNNILGIDLDTRAKQLSMFTLMLKACQQDNSFADAHCLPRVLDMPVVNLYTWRDLAGHMATALQLECANKKTSDEIEKCFTLMEQANNLGSIMKYDISDETRQYIQLCVDTQNRLHKFEDSFKELFNGLELILALTDKYSAVVMNPPYMSSGNMNDKLAKYVKDNYEREKADLFAVFMKVAEDHLKQNAKYGMINMQSWMFLSSFEKLRSHIIDDLQIDSMLHLGPRTFDELGGEVVQNTAFVITNIIPIYESYYYRLVDFAPSAQKESCYLKALNQSYNCKYTVAQSNFKKIPNHSIGYWISEKMIDSFQNLKTGDKILPRHGLATSDNNRFLKLWHEVDVDKTSLLIRNIKSKKWFPMNKGGAFRKWYGNNEWVINYENDGQEIKDFAIKLYKCSSRTIQNTQFYFKPCLTWSALTSGKLSLRWSDEGAIFGSGAHCAFSDEKTMLYGLGLMNSSLFYAYLSILSPTLNINVDDIRTVPYIESSIDFITDLVAQNIKISRLDWDAHETSWDFQKNELINMQNSCRGNAVDLDFLSEQDKKELIAENRNHQIGTDSSLIEHCYRCYISKWEKLYYQLHANEEELNQKFIAMYGLRNELSPEVPQNEITILQQGEISFTLAPGSDDYEYSIDWHKDVIIKQFISYAIGCIMGRYRLDRPGLNIAHPNPSEEELASYRIGENDQLFEIDDDAIIPLMSPESGFADCASTRVSQFIKMVFGEKNHAANMNFVQKALGKDLDTFFAKDFYADHKKRYQNRPIYWLFSSPKGAFQVLVYMHRMTPYTVERIRSKYLLPYIERLTERINDMNASILQLTSVQARALQKMEKDLQECREYHDMLHPIANQNISIDLDDGVVVNYAKFGSVLAKLK